MGAIIKTITIHSDSVNPLLKYCANKNKTSLSKGLQENEDLNISAALNYAANPLKTICNIDEDHKEILTTGVLCEPATAAQEFAMARQRYREITGNTENYEPFEYKDRRTGKTKVVKRQPVTAIHMIQSFEETDLDPHLVHAIGVEMLERMGLQGVVDTHLNKEHLHNHLIINTYYPDGTKWNCNLDERLRVRQISDEIQREYGINIQFKEPREQLHNRNGKSGSYKEWQETELGMSWKDQMKNDIRNIKSVAKDRNDYLSMMEAYGYKVETERDDEVTFVIEETGKKINDTTLGEEFSVGFLYPKNQDKKKELEYHLIPREQRTISVARYNADGTRRGLLEMMLRKAIARIQKLIGLFNKEYDIYTTYSPQAQIEKLEAALDIVREHQITDFEDLKAKTNEAGAKLSHAKAEMAKMDSEKNLYDTLLAAVNQLEDLRQVDTKLGYMELHKYSEAEIRKYRAKLAPISPSEKSAVAIALSKHPEYQLDCKYHELTPSEAREVIDFLEGKSEQQPKVVMNAEDRELKKALELSKTIHESRRKNIDDRFADTPADEKTVHQVAKLLQEHGIERDLTGISQADVMDIRNCLMQNPFSSPVIEPSQQETIAKILESKGMRLNRPINYLTAKEASQLLAYIKEPQRYREPLILKPYVAPRENDLANARKIMKAKGVTSTVPLSVMSKPDFDRFYTYLISHDQQPRFLQISTPVTNEERDDMFLARIEDYKPERMLYLTQYRDALNTLRACGYDVDVNSGLQHIRTEAEAWLQQYQAAVEEKEELSQTYHDLIKAKSTIDKSETQEFIYGQKVEKEEEIEVEEREERASAEETRKEQEEEQKRKERKRMDRLNHLVNSAGRHRGVEK